MKYNIPFSPPDITEQEIQSVCEVLRSGWITTGPKTQEFQELISQYVNCDKTLCVSSATNGLMLVLHYLGISEGSEVITTPYTYCATVNAIKHMGAKPVLADIEKNSFEIDIKSVEKLINNRTKAVLPVDIAGIPCNYDNLLNLLSNHNVMHSSPFFSSELKRPYLVTDAAHSFGASRNGIKTGSQNDFSVFSFHAVKNLVTAEGGAICFPEKNNSQEIYKTFKALSLHGQSKDALSKFKQGNWKYDVFFPGFKCNFTDIQSALGIIQLSRYSDLQKKRENICKHYNSLLKNHPRLILPKHFDESYQSSYHLYPVRISDIKESQRDLLISKLQEKGISVNVHFIPVPLLSAYKNEFNIENYPNALKQYQEEISLPVYSLLELKDVEIICEVFLDLLGEI